MNNQNNAAEQNEVSQRVPGDNTRRIIDSLAHGLADLTIGLLGSVAEEYNRRQQEEKDQKKVACVQLIDTAVKTGNRISKQKLYDIIPHLSYCANREEIAMYLGVSLDHFNAGVKSWYHWF